MTTSQTAAAEAAHSPGSRRTIPVSSVRIPHVCSPSMRLSALSRSPWLRSLDDSQLRALDATMTRRCWAAGEQLFRTGEDADALFVVAEGRVKLSQLRSDGSEAVTDIVGPGVLLGVIRTEGHRIQRETAEALVDTCTLRVPQAVFRRVLLENPSVAVQVIEEVTDRLARAQDETGGRMSRPVAVRLAAVLLRLSATLSRDRGAGGILLEVPLSRADIAGLTGSTPESVSRVLSRWKDEAVVDSGRRWVALLDVERLQRIALEGA